MSTPTINELLQAAEEIRLETDTNANTAERVGEAIKLVAEYIDAHDPADLEGDIETAEGDISSLQTRMTAAEGDIDAVETTMGTVEGEIGEIYNGMYGESLWSVTMQKGYIKADGTKSNDNSWESCQLPLENGKSYLVRQRQGNGQTTSYIRLFQVTVEDETTTYTQVSYWQKKEKEVQCPAEGDYILQTVRKKSTDQAPIIYDLEEYNLTLVRRVENMEAAMENLEVEAEPTKDSGNAVSSGGVYDKVFFEIDPDLYDESNSELLYGFKKGGRGFVDENGTMQYATSGYWYGSRVEMIPGHVYEVTHQTRANKTGCRIFRITESNGQYTWTQVEVHLVSSGKWRPTTDTTDGNTYVLQLVRATDTSGYPQIHDLSAIQTVEVKEKVLEVEEELTESQKKHLNICVLGNSYSMDTFSYVPFILKEYGVTCNIHVYYRGSGTINDLISQWQNSGASDTGEKSGNRYHFHCDTRTMNVWETATRMSAKAIVEIENDWDIIVFTQQSELSLDITKFANIDNLIALINASMPNSYKLGYHIAYTRNSADQKADSLATQLAGIKPFPVQIVFPVGTAVFDARGNATLDALGYSGHMWIDNVHLQDGIPCYIAALTVVERLFREYGMPCSVMMEKTRPTEDWVVEHEIKDRQTPSGGVSKEACGLDPQHDNVTLNVYLAQKAAIVANNFPSEIIAV